MDIWQIPSPHSPCHVHIDYETPLIRCLTPPPSYSLTLTTTSSMHKLTKIVDIWVTRPGPHPAPPAYQRDFGMTHNDDFIFYRNYSQLKLQKFI